MGCFSFLCNVCGRPINSDSFSGENARLKLIKDGKVLEEMQGPYDSYGRVFSDEKDPADKTLTSESSFEWKLDWGECCDLMFDNNPNNGLAAAHVACIHGDDYPLENSKGDPDQGWGRYNPKHTKEKVERYHNVYNV